MTLSAAIRNACLSVKTPAYLYDLDRLRARCRALARLPIDRTSVHFATMANDNPVVLAVIREEGHGVFVNSPRHMRVVLDLGFSPDRVVYAASNMLAEDMEACVHEGVHLVLDSVGQVELFADAIGGGHEIGVRLNVGCAIDGRAFGEDPLYRFGLLPDEVRRVADLAAARGIRVVGAHAYFGSDLMAPEILLEGLRRLARAAERLGDLRYLDVAGGFGVTSPTGHTFDLDLYARGASSIMREMGARLRRPVELKLEPGRYLVADCGYFLVSVVDVKPRPDRLFVGTNGSVAIFPRPLMYPERALHPCTAVGPSATAVPHDLPVYVCGNSTYSQDFLARAIRLPRPAPGDFLVFHNAGAYCRSMITEFLGKDRPAEFVLEPVASTPAR